MTTEAVSGLERNAPVAKKTTKKKAKKKTPARGGSTAKRTSTARKKKATAKKKTTKKATTKKKVAKKAAAKKKKTAKKKTAKKTTTKKKVAKKKATTKKKTTKKSVGKKTTTKKSSTKASSTATAESEQEESKSKTSRGRRRSVVDVALSSDADKDGYIIINGRRVRRIATDPSKVGRKRKRSATATDAKTAKSTAPKKSRLSETDLAEFRDALLLKRRQVLHAIDSLETESLRNQSGDSSHMPIHMADIGSDVFEQDLHLSISASERTLIREIDAALQRIADGVYGICEVTGKAIRKARLRAKPWARMNIDSARERDKHVR